MKGVTGDLPLTLVTIREVLRDCEAREVRRNIERDKPLGRAFIAKRTDQTERDKPATSQSDRSKRGDPPRHARDKKGKAHS
eukprot:4819013-Pleurochrysis_carterae.AAC.1